MWSMFWSLLISHVAALELGEDPPRDRTSTLRELGFSTRHLGPVQMTTDTALGVSLHDIRRDRKAGTDFFPAVR